MRADCKPLYGEGGTVKTETKHPDQKNATARKQ